MFPSQQLRCADGAHSNGGECKPQFEDSQTFAAAETSNVNGLSGFPPPAHLRAPGGDQDRAGRLTAVPRALHPDL